MKERLQNLINRLKKPGEKFLTVDGDPISVRATPDEFKYLINLLKTNYDAQGTVISNSKMLNKIGGVPLSQLMKTADFGGKSGVGASGEKVGKPNIGPTVEALKSMAMFAKLVSRGKSEITAEDVQKVGAIMAENAQEVKEKGKTVATTDSKYSRRVYDTSKQVQDTISINIRLSSPPFQRAINVSPADKQAWGSLQGIVSYVNSETDIAKYSRFFAANNKRDPVNIAVVGISGAKADISTTYEKPDGTIKNLSHMSMSIKAGSSMYDQASGMNEDGIYKFYDILGLNPLDAADAMRYVKFQSKVDRVEDSPEQAKARVAAVKEIYEIVGIQLKQRINALNDQGEAEFVHEFLGKLRSSIQGEGKLVYVNFDAKGTYNKLNPQLITTLAHHIDLDVVVDMESKAVPYIYIIDKISGKSIMHVRLAILKSGRMTHTFELDYLLDLIRDAKKKEATYNNEHPAQQTAEPAVQQATTTKPTAAKSANKPLGNPAAVPAKVPTKDKAQQTAAQVGDQMGADSEEQQSEKV
jgi:predicted flap endonuclease-1-like 5' DNA nuclease